MNLESSLPAAYSLDPLTPFTLPTYPVPPPRDALVSILLLRHGQTDWNYSGQIQGQLDYSRLTEKGQTQARMTGQMLVSTFGVHHTDVALLSPLTRAQQTFHLIQEYVDVAQFSTVESLKEARFPWQGWMKSDLSASNYADAYSQYKKCMHGFVYEGFSPIGDCWDRADLSWAAIRDAAVQLALSASENANATNRTGSESGRIPTVLIVAHNQANKALIGKQIGSDPKVHSHIAQNNACVNRWYLSRSTNQIVLQSTNDHSNLVSKTMKRGTNTSSLFRLVLISDPVLGNSLPQTINELIRKYQNEAPPRSALIKYAKPECIYQLVCELLCIGVDDASKKVHFPDPHSVTIMDLPRTSYLSWEMDPTWELVCYNAVIPKLPK